MTRQQLIEALRAEMDPGTDIDSDGPLPSDEIPDPSNYSDDMLIEEGRRYGILEEDEGIDEE